MSFENIGDVIAIATKLQLTHARQISFKDEEPSI